MWVDGAVGVGVGVGVGEVWPLPARCLSVVFVQFESEMRNFFFKPLTLGARPSGLSTVYGLYLYSTTILFPTYVEAMFSHTRTLTYLVSETSSTNVDAA